MTFYIKPRICKYCKKTFTTDKFHLFYCSIPCQFWGKVKIGFIHDCWEWIGSRKPQGYGHITIDGKGHQSHHLAWEFRYGKIPKKLWVLHSCDNKGCVNPSHLFLGTHQDNMNDMKNKNRHAYFKGIYSPRAKLNNQKVKDIRKSLENNEKVTCLAKKYNVSIGAISAIKHKRSWTHIKLERAALKKPEQ